MLFCKNCKRFVDEDSLVGTGEFFKGREHGCCPHCHSEELEEAGECEICGKPVGQYEQFCGDCKDEFMLAWGRAVSYVSAFAKKDNVSAERLLLDFLEREVF